MIRAAILVAVAGLLTAGCFSGPQSTDDPEAAGRTSEGGSSAGGDCRPLSPEENATATLRSVTFSGGADLVQGNNGVVSGGGGVNTRLSFAVPCHTQSMVLTATWDARASYPAELSLSAGACAAAAPARGSSPLTYQANASHVTGDAYCYVNLEEPSAPLWFYSSMTWQAEVEFLEVPENETAPA